MKARNISDMKLEVNQVASKGYKYRYNRDVSVKQGQVFNDNDTLNQAITEIVSPKGKKYTVDEYLKDNLTDYVNVTVDKKVYKYKTYLEAEVFVADSIAGE